MDFGVDASAFLETSGYEPNAQGELIPRSRSPFASAVQEMRALGSSVADAVTSEVFVPISGLGGLGGLTQQYFLSTPQGSRGGTPRTDPQLNWYAGALHASLRRQAEYRQEMFEQEASRAQDMLRFEEASAWVFTQGSSAVNHMNATRDEATRERLAERLRMSSME
eukprot:1851685-Amphidinium_carterae.1